MLEFANEKQCKGDSYTFCYDCNNEFGSESCMNCGYFDQEVENRLQSVENPTEIQKDFIRFARINLKDNCITEVLFYLRELGVL